MNISEKNKQGLKREYNLVIPAKLIAERLEARVAELASLVNMPGFRKGKVPASVVMTRYGKEVQGEILQTVLDEGTRKIVEDHSLRLAVNPSLTIEEYSEGKDLKAVIALEVMPDINAIDLSKISVERPIVEVSAKEVDEAIARIAEDNKPTAPVKKPRPIKQGDTAVINFIGRIDGTPFEGGSAEGHHLTIGSNTFIPGFEEKLIGAMPDTTVEIEVPFPDDYQAQHLAGKQSIFEVTITELRESQDAKIDDEFAKSLGLESLKALKEAMKGQLQQRHEVATRNKLKTSLFDALDKVAGKFDVPPTLLANEYQNICHAMNPKPQDHNHDHDHDHDHEHPPADEGMSASDKAEANSMAERRVRLGMVLTNIGQGNNIQVTEEERNQAVMAEAQRYPGQEKEVIEYFQKNPQAAEQFMGPIFENKVVDFILEKAKVKDKTITAEALYSDDEPATKAAKKAPAKKAAAKKSATKQKKG